MVSYGSKDMPSSVTGTVSFFDRFAEKTSTFVSRAWFFSLCLLLIVIWVPSLALIRNVDTWQLVINTATTIITFLMVALLQNSQRRADEATQHKLNAIADGLADFMEHSAKQAGVRADQLREDLGELRSAVGLEHRESA
jgi:low affinity Fe/Cu permease